MIIQQTHAYCKKCGMHHDAVIKRVNGSIQGTLFCPQGDKSWTLSQNPELYLKMRRRCFIDVSRPAPENGRAVLNFLPITSACNLDCTICSADADKKSKPRVLTVEEAEERGRQIRANGGKFVNLFGGEPTLHPDILGIVRALKKNGLSVGIASNGLLLGKNPDLARRLKEGGVVRVGLQFDSLKSEVLEKLGRDHLEEKLAAIKNVIAVGMKVGLNCTATKHNLPEVPALVEMAVSYAPHIYNMSFLSAAPVGRFSLDPEESVDREQIILALLKTTCIENLTTDDFIPLPSFAPWNLEVHSDCGVSLPLLVYRGKAIPLNHLVDLEELCRTMSQNKMNPSFFSKAMVPSFYLLRSLRLHALGRSLPTFAEIIKSKGATIMNIGVTNYKSAEFLDEQKASRCACRFYTSVGPVKGCYYFFRDENYQGSRMSEMVTGKI